MSSRTMYRLIVQNAGSQFWNTQEIARCDDRAILEQVKSNREKVDEANGVNSRVYTIEEVKTVYRLTATSAAIPWMFTGLQEIARGTSRSALEQMMKERYRADQAKHHYSTLYVVEPVKEGE